MTLGKCVSSENSKHSSENKSGTMRPKCGEVFDTYFTIQKVYYTIKAKNFCHISTEEVSLAVSGEDWCYDKKRHSIILEKSARH